MKRRIESAGPEVDRNLFLLDLKIQIATVERRFPEAQGLISQLRGSDNDSDRADRRQAILLMKRDQNYQGAIRILNDVIERRAGASIEFRAIRGIAAARLGDEALARREADFITRRSARNGKEIASKISIHFCLFRGNWAEALAAIEQTASMTGADYLLKAEALDLKARDVSVPLAERKQAQEEMLLLRSKFSLFSDVEVT